MAQKVEILLVDDLDGSEADETIPFALDGLSYEIDVSKVHAEEFRAALAPYVQVGRALTRAGTPRRQRKQSVSASGRSSEDNKAIRAWAADHGLDAPQRGRIPESLVLQFQAANPTA